MAPLLTEKQITSSPIGDGDAGLIFKANGAVEIFNTYTPEQLANPSQAQLQTMKDLVAMLIATRLPEIMTVLRNVADDPNVVPQEKFTLSRH